MQVLGEFHIEPEHPSLAGHFPGQPVVPGVVILDETLALLARHDPAMRIHKLPSVKFLQPLYPGEVVSVSIEQNKPKQLNFLCTRGESDICKGILSLD